MGEGHSNRGVSLEALVLSVHAADYLQLDFCNVVENETPLALSTICCIDVGSHLLNLFAWLADVLFTIKCLLVF